MPRRAFLRLALGGMTLPRLFRARAAAGTAGARERTALIVVWLQGGASHLETYDPKPQAPAEIRGPFGAVATRVPGTRVSELLPLLARVADKFSVVRSLVHSGFCHQQGNQQVLTGHSVTELKLKPDHPDLLSITQKFRSGASRVMPAYVALQQIPYVGAAYLGAAHEAFDVTGDPNLPGFEVPNLTPKSAASVERLKGEAGLRQRLEALSRAAGAQHEGQEFDRFQEQACSMLTRPEVARAL